VRSARAAAIVLLFLPLTIAASDPVGDVMPCPGVPGEIGAGAGPGPDLVEANGEIAELGTSAVWTLRFAEDLDVPDLGGQPFRIDILLRDPAVPSTSFGYYRGLNRLVRFDAVAEGELRIALLPELAEERFSAPEVDGSTMIIRVPGRMVSADDDLTGTSPGLERLRWGVIVRDGRGCDQLGTTRPRLRFGVAAVSPSIATGAGEGVDREPGVPGWIWWPLATIAVLAGIGYVVRRRGDDG
jgi:hypothetical protein